MKVYQAVFKEGETEGIYAIGLVYDPAMQDFFVALSEEEIKLSVIEEKQMIFGAVIIPNKDILRRDSEGNEFTMRFSEETIEKLAHNWISKGSHKNFSEQHETKLEGITAVEMWTVADPDNDKSNTFGKKYPKGTLVAMSKVDNPKTWADIKAGKINGYSIEAVLGLQNFNLKTEIEMTEEIKKSIVTDVIDGVKAFFTSEKVEEVEVLEPEVVKVKSEEVVEAVEEPAFDADAFATELTSTLKVEFKSQLDTALLEKQKEIDALKVQLSKQPEAEEVTITPQIKANVELSSTGRLLELIRNNG